MTYVEGFVLPVPAQNKDEFYRHAAVVGEFLREFGVRRQVEAWSDDLPDGKVTDFRKSVQAQEGEEVVFAWFEYPDRAARDAATAKMMSDQRMAELGPTAPFDGKRMIIGGFESLLDEGTGAGGYTDGFVLPVAEQNKERIARWRRRRPPCSRNMAPPAWSRPGVTTCRLAS